MVKLGEKQHHQTAVNVCGEALYDCNQIPENNFVSAGSPARFPRFAVNHLHVLSATDWLLERHLTELLSHVMRQAALLYFCLSQNTNQTPKTGPSDAAPRLKIIRL